MQILNKKEGTKLEDFVIAFEGHIKIIKRDYDLINGKWTLIDESVHYENHNVITLNGKRLMPHCLGDDTGIRYLTEFRIGADNTVDIQEAMHPQEPAETDLSLLYSENVYSIRRDTTYNGQDCFKYSYPNSPNENSVLFEFLVGRTEANLASPDPTIYLCAGVYNDDFGLFAQQTFPAMMKSERTEFVIYWEFIF